MARAMAGTPIHEELVERELANAYSFIPDLFRFQSDQPRLIAAEARLLSAVLMPDGLLTRQQKEMLLYSVASARGNDDCQALHAKDLARDDNKSRALIDFALQLASRGVWF